MIPRASSGPYQSPSSRRKSCSRWPNVWSTGDACGLQHTKSCGSRTTRCSAASRCIDEAHEAGWPPTFGSPRLFSGRWFARWIIAIVWAKARSTTRFSTALVGGAVGVLCGVAMLIGWGGRGGRAGGGLREGGTAPACTRGPAEGGQDKRRRAESPGGGGARARQNGRMPQALSRPATPGRAVPFVVLVALALASACAHAPRSVSEGARAPDVRALLSVRAPAGPVLGPRGELYV